MNKEIMDYEIISSKSLNEVVKYVKDGLNKGWQPYGELKAVAFRTDEEVDYIEYVQAMVMYEEIEND